MTRTCIARPLLPGSHSAGALAQPFTCVGTFTSIRVDGDQPTVRWRSALLDPTRSASSALGYDRLVDV